MQIRSIDSQTLAQYKLQQLDMLLAQQTPAFVKSYGINSLATLNFRGSSSAQTQIYWNGIPLNNASSGLTDISTLNLHHFERVNLVYGSSAALAGSGNVGAAILLDNDFEGTRPGKTLLSHIAAEAGSFGRYKVALKEEYQDSQTYISASILAQGARNNYVYDNLHGKQVKMEHANFRSLGGLIFGRRELNTRSRIKLAYWQQQFDRDIPPALFEAASAKQQTDKAIRAYLAYENDPGKRTHVYIRTGYSHERMLYKDSSISLDSKNITHTLFAEAGIRHELNNRHEYLIFIPTSKAWIPERGDSAYQNRYAIAASYLFRFAGSRLEIALNGRAENINRNHIGLAGMNSSFQLHRFIRLRANVQKTYRAPSLNEWYYNPGGNPQLKPEQGWSIDGGYTLRMPLSPQLWIEHELSAFNRDIKDWILWFGGAIWTPHNIARVHSRGMESFNHLHIKLNNKTKAYIGLNTSYVIATSRETYIPNDGSIGKQIPYSPRYNGQANIGLENPRWHFRLNHTYTGYRYTTVDESEYVEPYHTTNIYLSYTLNYPPYKHFNLYLQANNLFDIRYEIVKFRPMPGRNWTAGIQMRF